MTATLNAIAEPPVDRRHFGFALSTFGCRVNLADSLALERELREAGGVPCDPAVADVVIVNSCSVTADAERSVRQAIRRIARVAPTCPVIVIGCYASRAPEQVRCLPGVGDVLGHEPPRRVAARARELAAGARSIAGTGDRAVVRRTPCAADAGRTVLALRVQTGCDQRCAFCVVPQTRGPARSMPPVEVIAAVERAEAEGYREVVLTGVHLGAYGADLDPPHTLADLVVAIATAAPRVRLRLGSLEPATCPPALVDLAARGIVAPHFHLPLQHASAHVLAAMRRAYRLEHYAGLVASIRDRVPDASIGADVLVGFPGETDRDVDLLCDYLERSPLTYLHVFPFSDRPGTAARDLGEPVPAAVARERAARVRQVGEVLHRRFRRAQLGRVLDGLTTGDGSVALTGNYLKVRVAAGLPRNTWVRVRIVEDLPMLTGEVLAVERGAVTPAADDASPDLPLASWR